MTFKKRSTFFQASFTDPVHTKMLKETLILFLTHPKQEQILEKNSSLPAIECETHAATVLQVGVHSHSE